MPINLAALNVYTTWSICGSILNLCLSNLDWHIELEPYTYLPSSDNPTVLQIPRCIGPEARCAWRNITAFLSDGQDDTYRYLPLSLNVTLATASNAFTLGYMEGMGVIMNHLQQLRLSCTAPEPAYLPLLVDRLVLMVTNSSLTTSGSISDITVTSQSPLRVLAINGCNATGALPTSISLLTSLKAIDLANNTISGTLPRWDTTTSAVSTVNLSSNYLSGQLVEGWSRFGGCGGVLDLTNNSLQGTVPDSWLSSACSASGKADDGLSRALLTVSDSSSSSSSSSAACGIDAIGWGSAALWEGAWQQGAAARGAAAAAAAISAASTAAAVAAATANGSYGGSWPQPAPGGPLVARQAGYAYGDAELEQSDALPWGSSHSLRLQLPDPAAGALGRVVLTLPLSVLLAGNPDLATPGGSYAVTPGRDVLYDISDNACTRYDASTGRGALLLTWLAAFCCAFFGALVLGLIGQELAGRGFGAGGAAGGKRGTGSQAGGGHGAAGRVVPVSADASSGAAAAGQQLRAPEGGGSGSFRAAARGAGAALTPVLDAAVSYWRLPCLIVWLICMYGSTVGLMAALLQPSRRDYCSSAGCWPRIWLLPVISLAAPFGAAAFAHILAAAAAAAEAAAGGTAAAGAQPGGNDEDQAAAAAGGRSTGSWIAPTAAPRARAIGEAQEQQDMQLAEATFRQQHEQQGAGSSSREPAALPGTPVASPSHGPAAAAAGGSSPGSSPGGMVARKGMLALPQPPSPLQQQQQQQQQQEPQQQYAADTVMVTPPRPIQIHGRATAAAAGGGGGAGDTGNPFLALPPDAAGGRQGRQQAGGRHNQVVPLPPPQGGPDHQQQHWAQPQRQQQQQFLLRPAAVRMLQQAARGGPAAWLLAACTIIALAVGGALAAPGLLAAAALQLLQQGALRLQRRACGGGSSSSSSSQTAVTPFHGPASPTAPLFLSSPSALMHLESFLTLHFYASSLLQAVPLAVLGTLLYVKAPDWGSDSLALPQAHSASLAVCIATVGIFAAEAALGAASLRAALGNVMGQQRGS